MVFKWRESIACSAPPTAFLAPLRVHPLAPLQSELQERFESRYRNGRCPFCPRNYASSFRSNMDRRWWVLGSLILALLMQLVLIVLAVKTYVHLPPLRHARRKLLFSMAYGFFLFVSFWLFYSPIPVRITASESYAMQSLEGSATSAELDAWEHAGLYAGSVGSSGPNTNPECAVAPRLMNSDNTGYLFEYRGIHPSSKSQGCTRFEGFTITARPAVYRQTGIRSFFVRDRTEMAIHFTSENRAANDSDPTDYVRHAPN